MEPKILILHCPESGRKALRAMGTEGRRLPKDTRTFELPCTGTVNEVTLMESLEDGYDGVLVVACKKENCRYLDGNIRAEGRVNRVRSLLRDAGITAKAVDILFIAPDEPVKLNEGIAAFRNSLGQVGVTP